MLTSIMLTCIERYFDQASDVEKATKLLNIVFALILALFVAILIWKDKASTYYVWQFCNKLSRLQGVEREGINMLLNPWANYFHFG